MTVALAAARLGLAVADPESSSSASGPGVPGGGVPVALFEAVVLGALAVVGAVIASRRPRNAIGWILSAIPLSLGVLVLGTHLYWTFQLAGNQDAAELTAWVSSWAWVPAMVLALGLFPLLFPSGSPPTPRWRWVAWVAGAASVLLFVGTAFAPGRFEDFPVENPFGGGPAAEIAGGLGFVLLLLAAVASLVAMVLRFRRSRDEERQQMKWVTAAAVFFVFAFAFPSDELTGEDVGLAALLLGLLGVALAVAVAVLRYRLYDIDRLISATLVYAVLTVCLGAAFAAVVLVLGIVLGGGSVAATAVATLAVTLAFRPLRDRVQRLVDRRFNRRRYEANRQVDAFLAELREGRAQPELDGRGALLGDG